MTISRSGIAGRAEDLPGAGHARREVQPAAVPALDLAVLVEHERARADEAHLAAQHVRQLRKLVERGAAQEPPDARDARVVGDLEQAVGLVARRAAPPCGASAPSTIVRNLRISKRCPPRPTRCWRKNTGPRRVEPDRERR